MSAEPSILHEHKDKRGLVTRVEAIMGETTAVLIREEAYGDISISINGRFRHGGISVNSVLGKINNLIKELDIDYE